MVGDACKAAVDLASFLNENQTGDNYDFSCFTNRAVVVCTPYVIYVPLGAATALLFEDLKASVSLEELREFLNRRSV